MRSSFSPADHPDSYYVATARDLVERPALDETLNVDIGVIGGGLTGINTALELAQAGFSVAVLEAHRIGWGASGRNGGELIRGIGHDLTPFEPHIGQEGIHALQMMGFEAVDIVRERIQRYDIDCDLHWGYADLAMRPRHLRALEAEQAELQALGYPHQLALLDRHSVTQVVNSDRYLGALVDEGSGHLHPLNLLLGEASAAERLGVRLFESSPAQQLQVVNDKVVVTTPKGVLNCDQLVLAGNAYIGHQLAPYAGARVLPAGSYVVATESLDESLCEQLMPGGRAVADMRVALDYYRISKDRRLIFGGLCTYSGRDPQDIRAALQPNLAHVFPQLKEVALEYAWGGMIGIGANRLPQIGHIPGQPQVLYAQAYAGHGLNATHMAARVLAEHLQGHSERFDIFHRVPHMAFPGGAYLRSPLLAVGMLWHRFKDLF
ncbi:FAD-dependent oxidoreductase [Terasakiispira papahanaumokuakeensis]|uniref:FAD-dependent oxidoreductase n=1 Tax=Terasakiispira papahanaumokuakeensis TaxID=197479 RepID=A0A1E2V9V3_9GAMM|nr:FAD-binding oxidoreductase [Terasakiispira papahanaumokuakeensis]ODC03798.1 FAD-dependent oxidoreductase [Terasakiispira papahanaumokuakeensis]